MYDARDYWAVAWRGVFAIIVAITVIFIAFERGQEIGFNQGGQLGFIQGRASCAQGQSFDYSSVDTGHTGPSWNSNAAY